MSDILVEAHLPVGGVRVKQIKTDGKVSYRASGRAPAALAEKLEKAKAKVAQRIAASSDQTRKAWLKQVMTAMESIST
jgi:hypothetical protein